MTTYIPEKPCKRGHQLRYTKNKACVECSRAAAKEQHRNNPEYHKEYQKENRDRYREISRRVWNKWYANPVNAARHSALMINRIKYRRLGDKWNDVLAWIYLETPEGYECDHIDPIDADDRSGLQVPWNLQYVTRSDNSKKHNKTDYICESAITIDWEQYINKPLPLL